MNAKKFFEMKFQLIGLGVFFSVVSFLYEYLIDDKNVILTVGIMLLDIAWLILNLFGLFFLKDEKIGKSIFNAVLGTLAYFSGVSGIVLILAEGAASQQVFLITLETLVYLGPMIIILLPIIYFVMQFLE